MRTKASCERDRAENRASWLAELRAGIRGRFTAAHAAGVWSVEVSTARFRLRALRRLGHIQEVPQDNRWAWRIFVIVTP